MTRFFPLAALAAALLFSQQVRANPAPALDLSTASLVLPAGLSGPETTAARMLVEEVEKRSQVRWPRTDRLPGSGPAVVLGQRSALLRAFPRLAPRLAAEASGALKPEGYVILSDGSGPVIVAGNDARGVLYGAGRLLRLMTYTGETPPDHLGTVALAANLRLASAPRYAVRGHQIGYRPKTNAYDGWNVAMWEQYIRDLVVFGANAVEGIPPRSDDDPDSPHFTLPPMQMMIEQSRLARDYGIQYWVWYPAMSKDYSDPATVDRELKEWADVLGRLPQVDAVFVPGGDPGHTPPKVLFAFLEKQAAQLRRLHPGATLWMSPQGFNAAWMEDFYALMRSEPAWLEGIVYGPQQIETISELRARIPARYKIRFYPDITHCYTAQFPVANWDYAFAVTEDREVVNPRPRDEAAVFHQMQPHADAGVISYSEGCNDDVNKCIWSSLAWDPDRNVTEILRDYSHYFIGDRFADPFAQGLLALESNWRGPLLSHDAVYTTLAQFQALESQAPPAVLQNWRFQEALYRAYYDAADRARLIAETNQEEKAMEQLRRAGQIGSLAAMAAAEAELAVPVTPPAPAWRARVFELAEALFQSIHMQLSVDRYHAESVHRAANLDLIDTPLNNAPWLRAQFARIRAQSDEAERRRGIDELLNWTNPGPGGFYDNLGDLGPQPHLVGGLPYAEDTALMSTPFVGVGGGGPGPRRISSVRYAQTLYEHPLEMVYRDLDPTARYRLRVIYGTETPGSVRLVANDRFEIQPLQPKDQNAPPIEYNLPPEATAGGELHLTWSGPRGLGHHGRGVQVAEVWLIRAP